MKNLFYILSFCLLLVSTQKGVQAQMWSTQVTLSPHNTTLIGDASRFEYHYNCHSTFYMRYNDSSYICNTVYHTAYYTPISMKIRMSQDFVINDFKRFNSNYQGFIGSYGGVGMYGLSVLTIPQTRFIYLNYLRLSD